MSYQKKALKYVLLPGIFDRTKALFTSGFFVVASLIATIFAELRLLPANHPYLDPANRRKFGLRHVLAEASSHLTYSWKNIDRIIIYFTIVAGLIILFAQFIIVGFAAISQGTAIAQDGSEADVVLSMENIFSRPAEMVHQDITYVLMDRVFGYVHAPREGGKTFNSCIALKDVSCTDLQGNEISTPSRFPYPYHFAFQGLLNFYSYGLFLIGILIILYFIVVVVSETAASGSPFGQRYNKAWVPVRIILFLALLVPINQGMNAAQILTLYVAKMGSNVASNGWDHFNERLSGRSMAGRDNLVAKPNTNIKEINDVLQLVFLAKSCKIASENYNEIPGSMISRHGPEGINPYLVRSSSFLSSSSSAGSNIPEDAITLDTADYGIARSHNGYNNIILRFGSKIEDKDHPAYNDHQNYSANVRPTCGELTFEFIGTSRPGTATYDMQELYFNLVKEMWNDEKIHQYAECHVTRTLDANANSKCESVPSSQFATEMMDKYQTIFKESMDGLIEQQATDGDYWSMTKETKKRGWAGAAIWYNRIAELNGEVTSAVFNIPKISRYPFVMEYVAEKKRTSEENPDPSDMFNPQIAARKAVTFPEEADRAVAKSLYQAYAFWDHQTSFSGTSNSRGFFIDTINAIFGTSGLFDMAENRDVNPMAQLSSLGRGMMDATIRNIGAGFAGSVIGKIIGNSSMPGAALKIGSDFLSAVGWASLTISFILFYILPILPFIFFIFAVSGWLKSIFEAMVAMPLWAVAHISDWSGEGMAGPAAESGYFLLFEIFIRPILIVIGLIAGISFFSAMVTVLNDVFNAAVITGAGDSPLDVDVEGSLTMIGDHLRGPVDKFFYTATYVILCYMIGNSSFKLIDLIPNQILRWMGQSVETIQESQKDAAATLTSQMYRGGSMASSRFGGTGLTGGELLTIMG